MTPDLKIAPTPTPVTPTAERWVEFHALVRDVRAMQALYRRTMDPVLRRESEKLEVQLDAEVGWIAADLAAAAAVDQAHVVGEGGAA